MSGGSLDYFYSRVSDVAQQIREKAETPVHLGFADHLDLVAVALRDLEWVWSGDKGLGDEDAAIMAVTSRQVVLTAASDRAEKALADLRWALDLAQCPVLDNAKKGA